MSALIRRLVVMTLLLVAAVGLAPTVVTLAAPAAQGNRGESPCSPRLRSRAEPFTLLWGETTRVSLFLGPECGTPTPLHLMLALDASGSMAGRYLNEMKTASRDVIRRLNMKDHPERQVGVVKFNHTAETLCGLTDSPGKASSCVNRIEASGGTAIEAGIEESMQALRKGRGEHGELSPREFMVVLSDGGSNRGCTPVLAAAAQAKSQGITLAAVCIGDQCDRICMRSVASSPRLYFEVGESGGLSGAFAKIADTALADGLERAMLAFTLPADMEYVLNSAEPAAQFEPAIGLQSADAAGQAGGELRWAMRPIPSKGLTVTFAIRPLAVGQRPVGERAECAFIDAAERTGSCAFELPDVVVLRPSRLPTATDEPPRPTATPPPSTTVPPAAAPPRNGRPPGQITVHVLQPVYLPFLRKSICVSDVRTADVVLVIDVSTSMSALTSAGRSKLDATLAAASTFVDHLHVVPNGRGRHDQVAVVGFNDTAWIASPLSADRAAVTESLLSLRGRMAEGTRLDLAFDAAAAALASPSRQAANSPVIVLLTDGLPNGVPPDPSDGRPETTIRHAAERARAADPHTVVYTIGLGRAGDINEALLRELASIPGYFFHEPDAEKLESVYAQITSGSPCDTGARP
jgi:Mg-chelatase subunit ChlD